MGIILKKFYLITLIICLLFNVKSSYANAVCEAKMLEAAKQYAVPVAILYAVGTTETYHEDSLQPNALNIDGNSIFPKTKEQAMAIIKQAKLRGAKMIDIGCMQINEHYHKKHFESVEAMLDPTANVSYAAKFLKTLYQKDGQWTLAVADYHTGGGNLLERQRYLCRVIDNIVKNGFGNPTMESKRFCNNR